MLFFLEEAIFECHSFPDDFENKGDDRDNSDSERKLKLGRQWQAQAGPNYRYFMVFKNREFGIDGAYTLDRFMEIMRELKREQVVIWMRIGKIWFQRHFVFFKKPTILMQFL